VLRRSRPEENPNLQRGSTKPTNSLRWIESLGSGLTENIAKFHPLPGGEGRGEGERKICTLDAFILLKVTAISTPPPMAVINLVNRGRLDPGPL
jgi:hypothetical protein